MNEQKESDLIAALDRMTEIGWVKGYEHGGSGGLVVNYTEVGERQIRAFWTFLNAIAGEVGLQRIDMILGRGLVMAALLKCGPIPPTHGITQDIGPHAHDVRRPTTGEVTGLRLGGSAFLAEAGAFHYTDKQGSSPDYFTISVQREEPGGSTPYFEREFPASSVPASVLVAEARDIASFDAGTRTVTFTIGERTFTYTLPVEP